MTVAGIETLLSLGAQPNFNAEKLLRDKVYVNWPESSSSNSYLEIIMNSAAVEFFGLSGDQIKINIKKGKNNDYTVKIYNFL